MDPEKDGRVSEQDDGLDQQEQEQGSDQPAEQEQQGTPVMTCRGSFSLLDGDGAAAGGGEATLELWEEYFVLLPGDGSVLTWTYREILKIITGDYRVTLATVSGEKVLLYGLGYNFEDFLRHFFRLRGEMIVKDMLMHEKVSKAGLQGEYRYVDEKGATLQSGPCEPRIYETALVIIPQAEDPIRIPFSDIEAVTAEDYALALTIWDNAKVIFSMMGSHLDPLKKALTDAMNRLNLKTEATLRELFPAVESIYLRKAAAILRDGKAAACGFIEAISPHLWRGLEQKIELSPVKESYDFLKAKAQQDKLCIGVKKGLFGDLSGLYFWFLIPIYSSDPERPGNAVAMEAFSTGASGGQATYFFRLRGRRSYRRGGDLAGLHREADTLLKTINRGMLTINFRREPIYLSDEKLREQRYLKYLYAVNKLPALQDLRARFIGRISHTSPEQWEKDVTSLLRFNVATEDDAAVWNKHQD